MGGCVGPSSLIFRDGTVLDLAKEFPPHFQKIGISMSGGVESTALLLLLIKQYGVDNIFAFTGFVPGRREWEYKNAIKMAALVGLPEKQINIITNGYTNFTEKESADIIRQARKIVSIDCWFNGMNKTLFSEALIQTDEHNETLKKKNVFHPFIKLYKRHTIELFYLLGRSELLKETFSCTTKRKIHCGFCYCCKERVTGFTSLNYIDNAIYDSKWDDIVKQCMPFYKKR